MNYAIIRSGGKQYKVSEEETILVDKLGRPKGEKVVFPEVLLIRHNDSIFIGDPLVKKAEVIGRVVDELKGKKITVAKFKAKVRYRRKIGFRPHYTKVLIEEIKVGGGKKEKKSDKRVKNS